MQCIVHRSADELSNRWQTDPRWKGSRRDYSAKDVTGLRGSVHIESTLARRGAERLWQLLHTEPFVPALGAVTGNQAIQMVEARPEGHLPERLAGRGRRQPRRADVSRPEPVPLQQCAGPGAIDQQRLPPGRPDPARRGPRHDRLLRPHRRRRRGRLRRPAQRVRDHEGDDRSRRGGRALRGPACQREEVRPHGRQGARPDVAVPAGPQCRAGWPPT